MELGRFWIFPIVVDSLNGISNLNKVLKGIQNANELGLKIKINTVIIRGWNDDEIINFVKFANDTGLIVRFIEFMPLDGSGIWNHNLVVTKREIIKKIKSNFHNVISFDENISSSFQCDPATVYNFDDGKGKIGFISSITEPFCSNCDRVRLTSDGRFLTCLFEKEGYDLKKMMRNTKTSDQEIMDYIVSCHKKKPEGIVELIRINGLRPTLNHAYNRWLIILNSNKEYKTLKIKLFGILREKMKCDNLIVPIYDDNSISLKELGKYLDKLYPYLYMNKINFVFVVNKVIRNQDINVKPSDEIAIIPPISAR